MIVSKLCVPHPTPNTGSSSAQVAWNLTFWRPVPSVLRVAKSNFPSPKQLRKALLEKGSLTYDLATLLQLAFGVARVCPSSSAWIHHQGYRLVQGILSNLCYRGWVDFVVGKFSAPGLNWDLANSQTRSWNFSIQWEPPVILLPTRVQYILHLPELIEIFLFFLIFRFFVCGEVLYVLQLQHNPTYRGFDDRCRALVYSGITLLVTDNMLSFNQIPHPERVKCICLEDTIDRMFHRLELELPFEECGCPTRSLRGKAWYYSFTSNSHCL